VTVDFLCPKCGLSTPGRAEVPDDMDPDRPVQWENECYHCDAPLERVASVNEVLAGRPGGDEEEE
jgi:hypothetical protein